MKCDTCHKETSEVKRVLVDHNYDRTFSVAIYNCPDCFKLKESQRSKKDQSS